MDTSLELKFQDNINSPWVNAPESIKKNICCLPLIFSHDYDKYKHLEHSNKLLAPQSLLYGLSHYNNLIYPINLRLNNSIYIFTISEFIEDIDHLYIPNSIYTELNLKDTEVELELELEILNTNFEKGTKSILKPHESKFLKLTNPKVYLETHIKRQYTILHKNQTLSFPFYNDLLSFDIIECEPCDTISTIDTDLEVDFEKPYDYIEPKYIKKEDSDQEPPPESESKKEFISFSGKGNKLGNS